MRARGRAVGLRAVRLDGLQPPVQTLGPGLDDPVRVEVAGDQVVQALRAASLAREELGDRIQVGVEGAVEPVLIQLQLAVPPRPDTDLREARRPRRQVRDDAAQLRAQPGLQALERRGELGKGGAVA